MKYFIFSIYALFFTNFIIGCQHDFAAVSPTNGIEKLPLSTAEISPDEDWMFLPNSDSSAQVSPSGVGGESSQFTNCHETITVDFEPAPFGDLVQTIPYHIEKEPIHDAFISVKIAMHQIPWVIWFHSDSVKFKENYPVHFLVDDYTGNIGWQVSQNQSLFEMHLWDTIQAHNILYDFEQLKVELEIECYNN